MKIDVGVCETCRYYSEYLYDPSPAGVSLPPGHMVDVELSCDLKGDESDAVQEAYERYYETREGECPLWEPAISFCEVHKKWYLGPFCGDCEAEVYENMYNEVGD